jgi:hypothetical protein
MKVRCDFGVLSFFLVYESYFGVCGFCRTIRACGYLRLLLMRFGVYA